MTRKLLISQSEVVELYETHGKTTKEISEVAGVSPRQIRNILTANGVVFVENRRLGSPNINIDFFKRWTPEMAYVLGFVLTDGSISANSFAIYQKDPEILCEIRDAMESTHVIRKRTNNKTSYIHALGVSRKAMVDDLQRLGITRNKSLTVELPPVPDEYIPHFIRGVIDGDGWVHERGYTIRVTSGSPVFAFQLNDVFLKHGFNSRVEKNSGAYRIIISGKEDIKRLAKWLYADAGVLFLTRKRERMETHLNAS